MTFTKKILFAFLLLLVARFSFGQALLNYVPKDATFVLSINPKNLNAKVAISQLQQYDIYELLLQQIAQNFSGEERDAFLDIANSPSKYGMDFLENSYGFAKIENGNSFFGFVFKLSNEEQFSNYLLNFQGQEGGELVQQKDGYKLLQPEKDVVFAWNQEMALFAGGELKYEGNDFSKEARVLRKGQLASALREWVQKTMTRNADQSIRTHPKFKLATARHYDLHFWMDFNFFIQEMKGKTPLSGNELWAATAATEMLEALYKDTYYSFGLNFDKGEIALYNKIFASPRISKVWQAALHRKFNKKFLKYIPDEDLMGYWAFTLNFGKMTEAYKDLTYSVLKEVPEYGELGTGALDVLGIFIDEEAIYDLFKGDMLFAVTGMQSVERSITAYEYDEDFNGKEITKTVMQPVPEVTMLLSYGNEKDVLKLIRLGTKAKVMEAAGKYFTLKIPELEMNAYVALKEGVLMLTNNLDLVQNHLESGYAKSERLSKQQVKRLRKNGQVLYWDIPKTLQVIGSEEALAKMGVGDFLKIGKQTFESFLLTTSRESASSIDSKFSLNLVNKETNALKQFFELVNSLFLEMMGGSKT